MGLCCKTCKIAFIIPHTQKHSFSVQQRYELLRPKRTSLAARVPKADPACVSFLEALLSIDPDCRPTAEEALLHPWLTQMQYPPFDPSYRELLD